jgi:predicted MFS family arabinose efflux permease
LTVGRGAGWELRVLYVVAYSSTFDRFVIPPMLLAIAETFETSLARATTAASVYFLLYGVMQLAWGTLADRIGRLAVIRLTLAGAGLGGVLSAVAPSLETLIVARALTGAMFAGVIPVSLVYVGDTVDAARRPRAFAGLIGVNGIAIATATCVGGLAAYFASWRAGFLVCTVFAAALLPLLRRIAEPGAERPRGALAALRRVLRRPWAVAVVSIGVVEGMAIHGFVTFWSPAIESAGWNRAIAGAAVSLFGVAALAGTRSIRWAAGRRDARLMLVGGSVLAAGYGVCALSPGLAGILIGCTLVGFGYSRLHSAMQMWASEVMPDARATVTALFATALFIGAAIPPAVAAPLADDGGFRLVFASAAVVAASIALVVPPARRRFDRSRVRGSYPGTLCAPE